MIVNSEMKARLRELSKELFGSPNHWRRMVEKGERILVTEKDLSESKDVPVLHKGIPLYTLKRYTPEQALDRLLAVKKERENIKNMLKEAMEKQKQKKELQEKIKDSSGSAI